MELLPVTEESILKAAQVLKNGGIIAFPTETVYGLGADAYNPQALVKIFEAKGRPRFDPLIIHIADIKSLAEVANISLLSEEAKQNLNLLTEAFWPGPLSIVLPKSNLIPGIATSGLATAAVRFPANETAQKLIKYTGGAVAAPSANPFGGLSPTTARHVKGGLGNKVDIILDGGSCSVGVESTVLDITGLEARLLRHGGVPKEEIEKVIGKITESREEITKNSEEGLVSPGQLKSHYAPITPLTVFDLTAEFTSNIRQKDTKDAAWLFFDEASYERCKKEINGSQRIFILSSCGNISEACENLFEVLHEIDELEAEHIYAQLAPEEGLGRAINDRLRRAGA